MRMSWRGPRLLAVMVLVFATIGAGASTAPLSVSRKSEPAVLAKTLHSKNATEAAAAAYWLGLKGPEAVTEIPLLIATLGDSRPARASIFRNDVAPEHRTTPGEEAAGALARIGKPAVDPLIETLRTSSNSFARQNAAWALGQIDSVERQASSSRPRGSNQD
jgi:HEAT repeat protein